MSGSPGSGEAPANGENDVSVVLVTVPDAETGVRLARDVVEAGLAACGNLVPGLTSIYRWEGEVQQDDEALVIFKTTASQLEALEERIVERHPYEVPEFLVLPVVAGHHPYLDWVRGVVEDSEGA